MTDNAFEEWAEPNGFPVGLHVDTDIGRIYMDRETDILFIGYEEGAKNERERLVKMLESEGELIDVICGCFTTHPDSYDVRVAKDILKAISEAINHPQEQI